MPVRLEEIGPDDSAGVRACAEVATAASAVDASWLATTTAYRAGMEMRHGWDGDVGGFYLARADGEVVGTARLERELELQRRLPLWARSGGVCTVGGIRD